MLSMRRLNFFPRIHPLAFQLAQVSPKRSAFTVVAQPGNSLVKHVSGWESDETKRGAITKQLKQLGCKWDANQKAWVPTGDITVASVKNIIDSLDAIPTTPSIQPSEKKEVKRGEKGSLEIMVEELLEKWKPTFKKMLPKSIDESVFFEALKFALVNAGSLVQNSNEHSIYTACSKCALLGLTPGPLQEAYFSARNGQIEFQTGYKGLLTMARRVNPNIRIDANVVRGGDTFTYTLGDNPTMSLVQNPESNPEDIHYAYVRVTYPNGLSSLTVVDKGHVRKRMDCSNSANSPHSPWVKFKREMWLKTAIRDAMRFAFISPEESKREDLREAMENFKSLLATIQQELNKKDQDQDVESQSQVSASPRPM